MSSIAKRIPESFFCSITKKIMVDPVLSASTGLSYERQAIMERSAKDISPPLLISNIALREAIRETVVCVAQDMEKEKEKQMANAVALLATHKNTTDDMEIGIMTLNGSFRILCSTDTTILSLKNQISHRVDIPIQRQRLLFGGRQLEDMVSVHDYGIAPGSVLHLVKRLLHHDSSDRVAWSVPNHLTEYVTFILNQTRQLDGGGGGGGGGAVV